MSLCVICPEPAEPGRVRCAKCLLYARNHARATYRAERERIGYRFRDPRCCTKCHQPGHYKTTCPTIESEATA